jgi:hypothetical protein
MAHIEKVSTFLKRKISVDTILEEYNSLNPQTLSLSNLAEHHKTNFFLL